MTKKTPVTVVVFLLIGLALAPAINADINILSKKGPAIISNGNHPPIYIDGNDDFIPENGVTGGSGTENDPYIIEDWIIVNDSSTEYGIFINNTDAYFVIRSCSVYNYSKQAHGFGILLSHVENGRIENTTTYGNYYGTMVRDNSMNIEI